MSQQFWSGMTAALLTTVLSATASSTLSVHKAIAAEGENATKTQKPELVKARDSQSPMINETKEGAVATIYSHKLGESDAATLYVQGIPIFTFLDSAIAPNNPSSRAEKLAGKINQLVADKFDAEEINVSWDQEKQSYLIKVADEELIALDQFTTLAGSTKNLAEDAIQAANRLRRLLGNALPLGEIANQPAVTSEVVQAGVIARTTDVPKISKTSPSGANKQVRGAASWYGPGFHGRLTANGERFNQEALTAAHRTLRFGTRVRVTNLHNGRSVVVRINDRGPFIDGRVIDLSKAAARAIGMLNSGVAPVRLQILGR